MIARDIETVPDGSHMPGGCLVCPALSGTYCIVRFQLRHRRGAAIPDPLDPRVSPLLHDMLTDSKISVRRNVGNCH